ncbi:MAG: radical SAM protein [Syntrophobacterales bacterium]|nr:radical SAM protein [Syntrophobacterales bacterium]
MKGEGLHYEGIIIRPPSEAQSIIIQATVGCSHNKCTFCGTYKGVRFRIKDESTIEKDIVTASREFHFLKRVFLCDGDALIIPQKRLVWILSLIHKHMPWIQRVGLYGNAKSILMKSVEELRELKELGLGIIYLGVESGDPQVLKNIRKGVSPDRMIAAGNRVKEAGITLSVTVLLGIAGVEHSIEHARSTGWILSEIDPDYVGALTLMILPNTPLGEDYRKGLFKMPDQKKLLLELREMLAHTELSRGLFMSNHASNYLPLKVRFPRGKSEALRIIDAAIQGMVPLKPEWLRAL